MFIVYAADTKAILGFDPPQHTIKVLFHLRILAVEYEPIDAT